MEIDVWDGEPEDESSESSGDGSSSSSSSSDSSSSESDSRDKKKPPQEKTAEKQAKKKAKKSTTTRRSRINNAVSSKVGGILGRNAEAPDEPETHDVSSSTGENPATEELAARVPSHPEPMVLHGHTLTKGTTFRDVCYAIRDSAFVTSDLPVIVSLEVHACLEQQQTMVDIMQEAWKGLLIDIKPELFESPTMPILEDLKGKILIKVKWMPQQGDDHAEAESAEEIKSLEARKQKAQEGSAKDAPPKPSKILEALSRLAVYTKGFSFRHMDQPGMNHSFPVVQWQMINFVYPIQKPKSPATCSRYRKMPPKKFTNTSVKLSSSTTGTSSCACIRMAYA